MHGETGSSPAMHFTVRDSQVLIIDVVTIPVRYQAKPCSLCFSAMVAAILSRDSNTSSVGSPL